MNEDDNAMRKNFQLRESCLGFTLPISEEVEAIAFCIAHSLSMPNLRLRGRIEEPTNAPIPLGFLTRTFALNFKF